MDRKIVDYYLVAEVSNVEFYEEVQALIKDGWQPYGSPYAAPYGDAECLTSQNCQTMVMYDK